MKLTPAIKKLLIKMKDENLYIYKGLEKYHLKSDDNFLEKVRSDWERIILVFCIKEQKGRTVTYTLNPDAELSQTWLDAELKKRAQAVTDRRNAEVAETERLNKEATELFGCVEGQYTVTLRGQYPFSGEILFNGEFLMGFDSCNYGTKHTLQDLFSDAENQKQFSLIRQMVRAANQVKE